MEGVQYFFSRLAIPAPVSVRLWGGGGGLLLSGTNGEIVGGGDRMLVSNDSTTPKIACQLLVADWPYQTASPRAARPLQSG